ncbi:MAG TPA: peptidoglycan recognition family protein, partial [Patescibacteria group bacterium]|nr:peptidoglycan recognition family protein [Patescibacteria group bacterium]
LGWGDIGYNYLIDKEGNIYKGRKGKRGVVGGHTFNSATNTNYNMGTVGIALLGCYDEAGCTAKNEYTPQMEKALSYLVGRLSANNKFHPQTQTKLFEQKIDRVIGHRDVDATACPGNIVHDNLPTIRQLAEEYYAQFTNSVIKAELSTFTLSSTKEPAIVTQPSDIHYYESDNTFTITITYKNTGKKSWDKNNTAIRIYNKKGIDPSPLADPTWTNAFGHIVMNEELVQPGETASFTFTIQSPKRGGTKYITTKLMSKNTLAKNSQTTTVINFIPTLSGTVESTNFPLALFEKKTQKVTFTLKNSGTVAWEKSTAVLMNGIEVKKLKKKIKPGKTVSITFSYTVPEKNAEENPTIERIVFQLKQADQKIYGARAVRLLAIY